MKKFVAIITCLVLVFSFVACGKTATEEETTTTASATTAATTAAKAEKEEATTTLWNITTRFSHTNIQSMTVWTNGAKVDYKGNETKIMTATAALNDSAADDKFVQSDKTANFDDMRKTASCVEFKYNKDQTATFTGAEIVYDHLIVPTSGNYANIIFFLKDGAIESAIEVVKGENSEKTVSENVAGAVVVVNIEDHAH